jgi:hypothetical protein
MRGILRRAAAMISADSACAWARISPTVTFAFTRISSASSAALKRISTALRWAAAHSTRRLLLSTASWSRAQPSSSSARSVARALVIPSR